MQLILTVKKHFICAQSSTFLPNYKQERRTILTYIVHMYQSNFTVSSTLLQQVMVKHVKTSHIGTQLGWLMHLCGCAYLYVLSIPIRKAVRYVETKVELYYH